MANRHNSIKKIRADEKKRLVNKARSSEIRSIQKKFKDACEAKDKEKARATTQDLFSKLDKAVKCGTMPENRANRTKSRLAKRLTLIQA